MRLYILLLVALLASCSAEKRLNRLLKNNPEFTRQDTITVRDTVYFDRVEAHTVEVLVPGDTMYLDTGRLHVKVVKMPGERVYVQGICDADTVTVEKQVVVDRILPTKTIHKAPWYLWALVVALAGIAVIQTLRGRN